MSGYVDKRCAALMRAVRRSGCDCLLVTKPENVYYLSGFTGEDSWLVVGKGRRLLVTDSRFTEEAALTAPGSEVHVRKGGMAAETADLLKDFGARIGFEAAHLTVAAKDALSAPKARFRLVSTSGLVEGLRLIKDASEIAAIRKAVAAAEKALRQTLAETRRGTTEAGFAARLEYAMREEGAESAAFPSIVAGEPLSSLPHAKPTRALLSVSSTMLVDWGARVERYNSDLTRVAAWGKVTPRIARIWRVAKAAQKDALRSIKAGVLTASVDAVARRVIADAGFGGFFGHGLGHGVGLEVHEGPVLSPRGKSRLKAGMVVTVEPGIYLPGEGGVRLEDMVLVTRRGAELLTTVSRDPRALGALARIGS